MCDIVLLQQPLIDELFIYFLKNVAVQNDWCLLFNIYLFSPILMAYKSNVVTIAPQFAVVSPYYKSSLVIGSGAVSIAATNEGLEGEGYDRYF